MGRAVAIGRLDLTADWLRSAASVEKDGAAARRILALALILEGADRASAARICGMDRQTLGDWVHRYNDEGLAGLRDRAGGGRSPKLSKDQRAEFAALVEAGPDPALHKVVRGGLIGARRSSGALASKCTNVRSARSWRPWVTAVCPCARNIPKAIPRPRRLLKKLRGDPGQRDPRGGKRKAARNLVSGRSAFRPAGHAHPRVGQTRVSVRARRATSVMNGPLSSAPSAQSPARPPPSSCLAPTRRR